MNKKEIQIGSIVSNVFSNEVRLKNIYNMSHIYLMTLFEAFNKDFFLDLLTNNPDVMKSRKEKGFSYEDLLNISSIDELRNFLVKPIISKVSFYNIDEFSNKFLKKYFNIDIENEYYRWVDLREKYYRRNIIVHNSGKISQIYIQKMKIKKGELGRVLQNDFLYIKECYKDVHRYISYICFRILEKFRLNRKEQNGKIIRIKPIYVNDNNSAEKFFHLYLEYDSKVYSWEPINKVSKNNPESIGIVSIAEISEFEPSKDRIPIKFDFDSVWERIIFWQNKMKYRKKKFHILNNNSYNFLIFILNIKEEEIKDLLKKNPE